MITVGSVGGGRRAVIGFTDTIGPLGDATMVITDRGPFTPLRRDLFTLDPFGPTDCSPRDLAAGTFDSGDVVVRDAPSKDQCRNGGWRNYTDAAGQPFKNQGQCIAFALGAT
jgi:hypothetical protein